MANYDTAFAPEAKAILRGERISPRKVEIVLDLIRNQPVEIALAALDLTPKAACPIVKKLLNSAIANADNNHSMNKDALYVAACYVGPGPILKRIQPRAHGRAFRINKRTSNITIILKEKEA
ncbi:MAG: 50S ribosomal protein L22 [Oscillospiraceae bacterium]|nr:50S ribosomal protein L22 [Oscillospiraceae bacterium]